MPIKKLLQLTAVCLMLSACIRSSAPLLEPGHPARSDVQSAEYDSSYEAILRRKATPAESTGPAHAHHVHRRHHDDMPSFEPPRMDEETHKSKEHRHGH